MPPIAFSAMFREGPYLGFFGGKQEKGQSTTNFWVYHTKLKVWKQANFTEYPAARHLARFSDGPGKQKILFGGFNTPHNIYYNDVFIFDLENMIFSDQYREVLFLYNNYFLLI